MARTALCFAGALVLALTTTACGNPTPSPTPAWDRTQAEREVLFVVLRDVVATKDSSRYVLRPNRTTSDADFLTQFTMPEARASTLEDLLSGHSELLPQDLRGPAPIDWIDEKAFGALAPEATCHAVAPDPEPDDPYHASFFCTKFPGSPGITSFSHVGFSEDHSEALLEVRTLRNWMSGKGQLVLLRRTSTGWTVVTTVPI